MSTFKAVLLKGNIHLKDDGTSNIKIRITHDRKADYISTDLYIMPSDFDEKVGLARFGKNKEIKLKALIAAQDIKNRPSLYRA
jgi:hypothetical protein